MADLRRFIVDNETVEYEVLPDFSIFVEGRYLNIPLLLGASKSVAYTFQGIGIFLQGSDELDIRAFSGNASYSIGMFSNGR